ncbi:membrane protein [Paenibacillus kribbensis]|uniref:Membrane protein n=2 Tax=Paenibacillus kribbensis TaxID=172713 RepID=A0A222WNI5_9BACL|nr:membrane protein [Paenibacillus kribbensis]
MPIYLKFGGRFMILVVAMVLTALAVNLFIECNIGSDTLTVLLDGLHKSTGMSVGLTSFFVNMVLLAAGLLLNRKSIGFSSMIYSFFVGPFINWIHPFIAHMELSDLSLFIKIVIVILANFCYSITYVLLMKFGNGMYAIDAVLRYTESKFGLRYDIGRIGVDAIFLSTGFFFGGIVGIGTVIAFALTGPGTLLLEKILFIPLQKKSRNKITP